VSTVRIDLCDTPRCRVGHSVSVSGGLTGLGEAVLVAGSKDSFLGRNGRQSHAMHQSTRKDVDAVKGERWSQWYVQSGYAQKMSK